MNKKVFWIMFSCMLVALITSVILFFALGQNFAWAIVMAVMFCISILFVFFSILFDYVKKKLWMGLCIVSILTAVFFVLIAFQIHTNIQMVKKEKEIKAISLQIEAEEDADERWRMLLEEKAPLIDEKFILSQQSSLFNIAALITMGLISVPSIIYRNKKNDEKNT